MDEEEHENAKNGESSVHRACLRSFFAALTFLSIFVLLSLSVLYVAVFLGNLSVWNPMSVHSLCRIISSRVDLRSSKVCELGLLNYKAKRVFYPSEKKKYRCHYDYYWASVFEVEYIDHSGHARSARAEAPNEALPYNCRPNFGVAWLTKDKFKVNGTYECWYTLGISKVDINFEGLFDCRTEDPSMFEMIKRYYILFTRILKAKLLSWGSVNQWRWETIVGAAAGYTTALLSVTMIGLLQPLMSSTRRLIASQVARLYSSMVLLKRICFFVTYLSFMSWVTIQYVRWLGLSWT